MFCIERLPCGTCISPDRGMRETILRNVAEEGLEPLLHNTLFMMTVAYDLL